MCRPLNVSPYIIIKQIMISDPLGSLSAFLLKPALGGVDGITQFSTGHKQTQGFLPTLQYSRVCYFHLFAVFISFKGSNYTKRVYISQLIQFATVSGHVTVNNTRNKMFTVCPAIDITSFEKLLF